MQYLWSLGLLVFGVILLVLLALGFYRLLRRARTVRTGAIGYFGAEVGLLKQRLSGIRAALAERRHRATD